MAMASKLPKIAPFWGTALLCAGSLVSTGCLLEKKRHVVFTPPPARPPAKIEPAPELPNPPLIAMDFNVLGVLEFPGIVPDLPEPPKAQPRPKPPPVIAGPKPPATLPDQPTTPRLGPLLPPDQV